MRPNCRLFVYSITRSMPKDCRISLSSTPRRARACTCSRFGGIQRRLELEFFIVCSPFSQVRCEPKNETTQRLPEQLLGRPNVAQLCDYLFFGRPMRQAYSYAPKLCPCFREREWRARVKWPVEEDR